MSPPLARPLARRARTFDVCVLLVGLLVGIVGPALGAQDPWKPRGRDRPDRERYEVPPRGFKDQKGPVIVEPSGAIRTTTTSLTNIVVIMLDDLPEIDLRVWRRLDNIRTLFLEQGLRFTRYHGNDPLCCPGRANVLTGLTTDHHGVWTNEGTLLDPRVTIATELRAQGYFTVLAGKYLNRSPLDRQVLPGWSRTAVTKGAYYNYRESLNGQLVFHDDDPNDYQPDVAFNRALRFMRQTPAGRPLFALITPYAPHSASKDPFNPDWRPNHPAVARRFRDDSRCAGIGPWRTAAHGDDNSDRPLHQRGWDSFRAGYPLGRVCRSLLAVDAGIGRVVNELTAQGRIDDTLLVLTADNGMGWGAHGRYGKPSSFVTHLPLFVRWPAGRGTTPSVDHTYLSNVDLAPTLCEVGGCVMGPYPDGPEGPDGTSFLGVIRGTGEVVRQALYSQHLASPLWRQVMTTPHSSLGLWHYVEYGTGERELYDAAGGHCWDWSPGDAGDPCELTNLAGHPDHAAVEASLHDMLAAAVATEGAGPRFSGRETRKRRR